MKIIFVICLAFIGMTLSSNAQEVESSKFDHNFNVDTVNVRLSAGYEQRLVDLLEIVRAELKVEQDKQDEARSRRRSMSRAMAKRAKKINELTARMNFIESEIQNIPVEIKAGVEKVLENTIQGDRDVHLNIQIGSFSASTKEDSLWSNVSANTLAATVVVVDAETSEILASFVASDNDVSQYSAQLAGFKDGAIIGSTGLAGFLVMEVLTHSGRTDLIEDFSTRTVSVLFPEVVP